jgi:hypothetical protein
MWWVTLWFELLYIISFLLVGLILTALNGPVGTESRGVADFANLYIAPLVKIWNPILLYKFNNNKCKKNKNNLRD